MRRFGRAVLGGTFDHLHLGHESLLQTAFQVGREVAIGLTSERYLADHPKPDRRPLASYATRRRALTAWLRRHHPGARWKVVAIDDPFGGSIAPGVGVLVVSADTVAGGQAVNRERHRRGLASVPLVVVPLALADDLRPIASRRIREGAIDRNGRRRSPIRIDVRTARASDLAAARRATRVAFPTAVLVRASSRRKPSSRDRAELSIRVSGPRAGGWTVAERSRHVKLRPVRIPGSRDSELARGLRALLRPTSAPGPK